MPAVTETEVRQYVEARLTALSGWTASSAHPAALGADPAPNAHLTFSVDVPTSRAMRPPTERRSEGTTLTETSVVVRFLSRVAPKSQVTAYEAGLAAERQAIAAAISKPTPFDCAVIWMDTRRERLPGGEWTRHTLTFTAYHALPIA